MSSDQSATGAAKDIAKDAQSDNTPSMFDKDGAIGKHFEKDGAIGGTAEKIGGPLSSEGAIGKQFTSEGAIGGTVQDSLGDQK